MAGWLGRNVLVLSPTPTAPVDFGNRRYILNSFRRLQDQGARIIFLYYPAEHDWRTEAHPAHLREMQAQWDEFYVAPVSRPLHTEPAGSHHEIDEWWDDAIGTMLTWIFTTHRIDACIVNYTWLTRAFTFCPKGVLRILDTHDRFSGRKEMLEAHGICPEFFYLTEQAEQLALQRCDLIWAIKEDEAVFFRSLTGVRTLVFPHVEQRELAYRCRIPRQALLCFGFFAARNAVNVTNYHRFFRLLETVVRRGLLPARFVLAGSMCDLLGDQEFPFIERLGTVESVESFYNACDVVVVPMAFSTGLKIKVGEALGYGKAVIAHAHAFDGYQAHHRFQAMEDDFAICAAIIALIDAPEEVDVMERAAIRSARDAERVAADCVARSILPASAKRRFVVLVSADLLAVPFVVDHLSETCGYIRHVERPALYVTGDVSSVPASAWRQLSPHADLFASPEGDMKARSRIAANLSFETPQRFLKAGIAVLYALRCDADFALWQARAEDCLLRLEDWGPVPCHEITRSAACLLSLSARDQTGLMLIGSGAAESALRRLGVQLPLIRIPLLRDGATSAILPFICAQNRAGICLLGAGCSETVLRAVTTAPVFRARWADHPRLLVLTQQEQAALVDPGMLAGFEIIRPDALLAHFRTSRKVPELIVQLGAHDAGNIWLRELCARAILPFITLSRDPLGDGVAANLGTFHTPAPAIRQARQALRVLDAIVSETFIETEKAALRKFWPFAADSGWAWLWRLVEHRIAA